VEGEGGDAPSLFRSCGLAALDLQPGYRRVGG